MPPISPFRVDVSHEVLDDLRTRVLRARLPAASDHEPWAAGTDPAFLRRLLAYWVDDFDWRAVEAKLNELPQYRAEIDGRSVHFLHMPGTRAGNGSTPSPLILSHGWPS